MIKNQYEQALSYSKAAMSLLKKSKIPPTPEFYELLYTYATGTNTELNVRINKAFAQGDGPDAELAAELHDKYMQQGNVGDKLSAVSAEIASRIDAVHGAIDNASENADNYSGMLQSAMGDLELGMDREAITALTASLLDETKNMRSANAQLEERLNSARDDISALQRELDEVRSESMMDPLTKIPNRKAFDQELQKAIEGTAKKGKPLSLLLVDIDHFKQFNDTYGHQTGDQVLRLVAMTLGTSVKDTDTAARYGGEEFAVILPDAELKEALYAAERMRMAIQSKELLKRSTNEKLGRVTASFGVATFRKGDTAAKLIERADLCLYAAKNNGRNRIVDEDSSLARKILSKTRAA